MIWMKTDDLDTHLFRFLHVRIITNEYLSDLNLTLSANLIRVQLVIARDVALFVNRRGICCFSCDFIKPKTFFDRKRKWRLQPLTLSRFMQKQESNLRKIPIRVGRESHDMAINIFSAKNIFSCKQNSLRPDTRDNTLTHSFRQVYETFNLHFSLTRVCVKRSRKQRKRSHTKITNISIKAIATIQLSLEEIQGGENIEKISYDWKWKKAMMVMRQGHPNKDEKLSQSHVFNYYANMYELI